MEKKPYALTDADFGLWQDSENAWGMRLKAQPVRTDFNLSDTGLLTIDGTWQRAAALRVTPLQFNLLWERAQLGQASKLVYGNDKGWRGTIEFVATLRGTPGDLLIWYGGVGRGFPALRHSRRRSCSPGGPVQWSLQYRRSDPFETRLPRSGRRWRRDCGRQHFWFARSCELRSSRGCTTCFRCSPWLYWRVARKNIPMDLVATGKLEANANYVKAANASPGVWTGSGEALGLHLSSKFTKTDLLMDKVPFAIGAKAIALPCVR